MEHKKGVLKAKRVLKNSTKYSHVYIENDLPLQQRINNNNNRTLLKALGRDNDFMIKSGRVVRKQSDDTSVHNLPQIRFSEKNNPDSSFYTCVVYLPPENSTRSVNIYEFLDSLSSDIYTIPNGSPFYLFGDWNSQVSDMPDFIEGIDILPERNVVDFTNNSYGDIFCEFLSNVNCCILNGRNFLCNDFTFISTRGTSVVDYCIMPYEYLNKFVDFEVIRAQSLVNSSFTTGAYDPKHIPDHSLICWTFNTLVYDDQIMVRHAQSTDNETTEHVKFDTRNVPNDWLTDVEVVSKLNQLILDLEHSENNQLEIDNKYDELVNVIQDEMNSKLDKRKVYCADGIRNHEMALKDKDEGRTVLDDKECYVAVLLTNHLLSPLIPAGHDYIIDNRYQDKPTYCPCWSRSCRKIINYGRTSIGNSRLWYGYPDVVLLPNTVMVEQDIKQEEEEKEEVYNSKNEKRESQICELEINQNLHNERIASQIISQTITASLYTSALRIRKPELGIPDISLIPSLILTPSTYCIYMYDSKHDILLTSGPNPTYLWDDSGLGYQFNKSAIMHIWMALNHFQLLPSLDPAHIEFIQQSSNFQKLCEMNGLELPKIAGHILFQSKFVRPEKFGHKNQNTKRLESSRYNTAYINSTKKYG
ncbi:unnamed protein product [Mytilus coruscus]|uniref:Endonuclease/exonuclease/phosphatase domain-containing protein n=1 Tax=Mytilus coruscus TaxID=42192 RepID=A0A6J8CTW7_MYTCO|nr:unnamed protein product [Mytilus coruscus]